MVSTSITMSSHEGELTAAAVHEHQCSICGDCFKIKDNLLVHQSVRHCQGNPLCLLCGKSFKRKASFKAHVISHLVEETLTCGECGEEMMDQKQLVRHTRQHQREMKEKLWRCKYCPRDFIDFKYYKEHLTAHSKLSASMSHRHHKAVDRSRFRHKCDVCTKSFQKPSQLGRHKLIHSGEKPYTCGECGKSFNQKGTLHTHVKQHSGEKQHSCQFCSATFSQRGNLRSHVQRVHTVSTEDRGEVYYCQYCSCVFRKIGSLNAHLSKKHLTLEYAKIPLSSSESDKATSCEVSAGEQDFTMKKLVTEVIEGEKWHLCPCCPKKFKKPSDLVKHIRIHTNEKPYRCPHCIRSFTVKSTLTAHMRTHSGFKEFNCEKCSKPFASRSTLKVHMKKQHITEVGTN